MEPSPGPTRSCAWCGASLEAAERTAVRAFCPRCGVASTDPWPSPEDLADAYGGWYRPSTGRFGIGDRLLRFTRGRLARRLDELAPPGSVLDVGAGDGTLVDALRRRGREAVGLDPYSERPDFLRADVTEATGPFAAVVFWHSLEHLGNPTHALDAAIRLLTPGGLLVIAMPNAASVQAEWFGDRWLAVDVPRHLVHVPSAALLSYLRDRGLSVARISYVRGGQVVFGWLHGLVATLAGVDLYDAIRTAGARRKAMGPGRRALAVVAGILLLPAGVVAVAVETVMRRGGTVYVEATRPSGP